MNIEQAKRILEAAILSAENPITAERLTTLFDEEDKLTAKEIKRVLEEVSKDYQGRGIELKETASGYRFQVQADLSPWLLRLTEEKPPRYSRALLETLALIAYRQPITRAEIEEVRGVAVNSQIIKTLLEREWIKEVGHRDVPGKPALFATTKEFLDYFNLKSLSELPSLMSISDIEQAANKLQAELAINDDISDSQNPSNETEGSDETINNNNEIIEKSQEESANQMEEFNSSSENVITELEVNEALEVSDENISSEINELTEELKEEETIPA